MAFENRLPGSGVCGEALLDAACDGYERSWHVSSLTRQHGQVYLSRVHFETGPMRVLYNLSDRNERNVHVDTEWGNGI